MEQWIEEVLFRGRPPSGLGSDQSPRLHVVIGMQADDPFTPGEKVRKTLGPMDMASAIEKFGYTPAKLVAEINISLSTRISELETKIEADAEAAAQERSRLQFSAEQNIAASEEQTRQATERAEIAETRLAAMTDELAKARKEHKDQIAELTKAKTSDSV